MPGIEASPSFVREPEGNGVAERFIRTLKENLLWVRTEVAPLSWTPDLLNFGSPQWQESTHPIRRNFTGRPPEHGHLRALQPLLAVEFLVAIDGGVVSPVKAVSHEGGAAGLPLQGLPPRPYSATKVDG